MRPALVPAVIAGLVLAVSGHAVSYSLEPSLVMATSCAGETATIVGTPGQERLSGTTGADVIVSNGARLVYAAEGEDLVCLTGGDATVVLDGYNEFDNTGEWADDRLIGSGGSDRIVSGAGVEEYFDLDQTAENGDLISLGPGDSTLEMDGVPVGAIDGGSGRDRLHVKSRGDVMAIDAMTSIAVAGHQTASLIGIESFHLEEANMRTIRFLGSPANEGLYANVGEEPLFGSNPDVLQVDLGAGDDIASVPSDATGHVSGGPGANEFLYSPTIGGPLKANVTLINGRVEATRLPATVKAFQHLRVYFNKVEVDGDHRANRIEAAGCAVHVSGRGGDDHIRIDTYPGCDDHRLTALGGPGDDRLVGGMGRDILVGGSGHDRADGNARRDWCQAERRRNCELRGPVSAQAN